jgi:methylmalonyl-CoA mutase N-terminal domain/subunit
MEKDRIGQPGEFPFTRGIYPDMYRKRLWTMRQYAGFGSAAESNRRYKYLLSQGITGLSIAFDLPTQMGLDPDHALAGGEVGRTGVSICSLRDMEALLDGISLEQISASMTINSTASTLLAFYVLVADSQGARRSQLSGTIQNDILKEYVARGTYIYPPRPALRIVTDIFAWASAELPEWNTISISGYHIREAGSTAVQEIAFTLANAICYIQAAIDVGLPIDTFAPRLSFFFNAHNGFLEEIAKYRAARRVYAHLLRDRFGARNPRSLLLRFHTQTAGSSLQAQQPEVNTVRTTLQALSAVLGGTQSLHTNSMDEALGLPTEAAATLALRTQQVIAYESGIPAHPDPFGGSHVIEALTDQMEAEVLAYLTRIDGMGGALAAIESGYMQSEIHDAAYRYQQRVEAGEQVVVGVNRFLSEQASAIPVFRVDRAAEQRQIEALRALRASRSAERVESLLAALRTAALGAENLMPCILAAARELATLGEIADTLRSVFGEYRDRA